MQKGLVNFFKYSVFLAMFSLIIIIFSNNVYGYMCDDGFSPTECVCGHTPNSLLGYGQVIIGMNVYSCNNFQDGICPEDFTNGTVAGNCSSCPDYDCSAGGSGSDIDGDGIINNADPDMDGDGTLNGADPDMDGDGTLNGADPTPNGNPIGYVYGYVRDKNGSPLDRVIIKGNPVKWDATADLDRNTTSGANAFYTSPYFITGTYYFSASKDGYDTQLIKATVTRGANTSINFTLQDGTCHEDCTNSYNRCNAACDGVTFGNGTSNCSFYNNEVKTLCSNREFGTQVRLPESYGGNATHAYFVDCCEGTPELKYYAKIQADTSSNTKNIIKIEKIAKYNDVPVRVIISYWQDN